MARALCAVLLALAAGGGAHARPPADGPNVILVTVDGVRWNEVFLGADPVLDRAFADRPDLGAALPLLWESLGEGGFLTGDPRRNDPFTTRNLAVISLPGYQSILAGRDLRCWDNACPWTRVETVLERVRRELGLGRREVAVFAGWPKIARAAAKDPDAVTINVGFEPALDEDGTADAVAAELNRLQVSDLPPWEHRYDRYTWAHAMNYLERHRPRFLYVALGDPDEWAHRRDYGAYFQSLRDLDGWLAALRARLATMGEYGARTSVLVTTDHGRAEGAGWVRHSVLLRGSERAWLYARTPHTTGPATRSSFGPYDHLNVRPTIEALFGLAPCGRCSRPIREVLP